MKSNVSNSVAPSKLIYNTCNHEKSGNSTAINLLNVIARSLNSICCFDDLVSSHGKKPVDAFHFKIPKGPKNTVERSAVI